MNHVIPILRSLTLWSRRSGKTDFTAATACIIAVLVGTVFVSNATAQEDILRENYKGIELVTVPPISGVEYDIDLVTDRDALRNLVDALDVIYQMSPFSVDKIETLKRNGQVVIVYNPNIPKPKSMMASVLAAQFQPHYDTGDENTRSGKSFLVIVTRFGIKWPVRELAAVLVHELIGHATQYLEGRLETMRRIEIECEAWLYQEMAHQHFGMDKYSRKMIEFRQQLVGVNLIDGYCTDFKRYIQKHMPERITLWESLNPDVPKLLIVFQDYLTYLEDSGVTMNALEANKVLADAELKKVFNDGSSEDQYAVAESYLGGIGERQDQTAAAKWFRRAAERGHGVAQYRLGVMYYKGQGVPRNFAEAVKWYRQAGDQGVSIAQFRLADMYQTGTGVAKQGAEAAKWYRMAAAQGLPVAQFRLAHMYMEGKVVEQNFDEAAKWMRLAAGQGHTWAQALLASLYVSGKGVPMNLKQAYFWSTISSEHAEGKVKALATKIRKVLGKMLTPEQISATENRALAWRPKAVE